jgi:hypothetical protein
VRELMVERWLSSADAAAAWRRRAPGGEEATVASRWIPEFDAATRGRWVAAAAGDAAGEAWTLMPPGGRQARLFWVPGAVIVCDLVAGRCEQARLEAATLESLRLALARQGTGKR